MKLARWMGLVCLASILSACGGTAGTLTGANSDGEPVAAQSAALDEANVWAFALVNGTTVDSAHSRSSGGGTITASHPSTGNYTVNFATRNFSKGGNALVTAVGTDNRRCNIASWGSSGGLVEVNVACYTPSGSAANSAFSVFFQEREDIPSDFSGAYLWNDDAGGPVSSYYSWNSTGAANTVTRTSTGTYTVRLPGVGGARLDGGGNVQLSAYGTSGHCNVNDWGSGPDAEVDVSCFNAAGALANSRFSLSYSNLSPTGTVSSGFAWHSDNSQNLYTPDSYYRALQFDGFPKAQQDGDIQAGNFNVGLNLGQEFVSFNPSIGHGAGFLAETGSAGIVTTYSFDSGYCKISDYRANIATIDVNCFNASGKGHDSLFSAAWVTDQRN